MVDVSELNTPKIPSAAAHLLAPPPQRDPHDFTLTV